MATSTQHCCSKRLGHEGFTLLELIVVLVIISAAVLIMIPTLVSSSNTELKASARDVVSGLRRARSEAVTTNQSVAVTFNLDTRAFAVLGKRKTLPPGIKVAIVTARSEQLSEADANIRFFPDGSSTGGRVTLSTENRSYAIDIDWFTGKLKLVENPDAV